MKLEKVNDNQIRCTLTKEDLEARSIKISEIAYGSTKAKMLFKDVMQQASYEFGFEAENIPLMIEAIPMSTGCVVFIITKVENPEELDTRFSRFAPTIHENEDSDEEDEGEDEDDGTGVQIIGSDIFSSLQDKDGNSENEGGIFDFFKKIASKQADEARKAKSKGSEALEKKASSKVFVFENLENVAKAARVLKDIYEGESSLYKNPEDGSYYLLLKRGFSDEREFLKIGNLMLEYGSYKKNNEAGVAYMKEHFKLLIENDAVNGMAQF